MKYVGNGGGNYILETTYKFVGGGTGDHELVGPPPSRWPLYLGGAILVMTLLIAVVVLLPSSVTSTTIQTRGSTLDCLIWGDPHVQSFDKSYPNFYGEGEFWVLKTDQVKVQARLLATPFTKGLAATNTIVVGIKDDKGVMHKVSVGPMENGKITCDGSEGMLIGFPSKGRCGPVDVEYNDIGEVVDPQADVEKHIVHLDVPLAGFHMEIFRWANHVNARVSLQDFISGVDGICGNKNGNAEDDSTAAIMQRLSGRVAAGELLFNNPVAARVTPVKSLADCEPATRSRAVDLCKKQLKDSVSMLLDSCVFDVCFGGEQYAVQDGMAIREKQLKAAP